MKDEEIEKRVEEIEKMFEEDHDTDWEGDNALQGLLVLSKYFDMKKTDLICGADHDVIYSVSLDAAVKAGITDEDLRALVNLNWSAEDGYFSCFV